jgi:hypothetical protein
LLKSAALVLADVVLVPAMVNHPQQLIEDVEGCWEDVSISTCGSFHHQEFGECSIPDIVSYPPAGKPVQAVCHGLSSTCDSLRRD